MAEEKKESKQERFKRVVTARVNKVATMIRLIGNCSNSGNYEYTEEDVRKMFDYMQQELDKAFGRYNVELHGGRRFSLSDDVFAEDLLPRGFTQANTEWMIGELE
jgi:hypothetical protein